MNPDWETMLMSMEKRRDKDARFFKPTALIAVIDGITDGSLTPSDIDPGHVIQRFDAYLRYILPERASSGWRPFWHLSRDGAWIFEREQRVVGPEDFATQRKPNSRRELIAKIDHVYVPPRTRRYWRDPSARAELRDAVIAMLEADDADSRLVAARLRTTRSHDLSEAATEPAFDWEGVSFPSLDAPGSGGRGQGFRGSLLARRAVEAHAMTLARAELEREGWIVTDVSLTQSYDLHCERDGAICHVEVKGTVGLGDRIIVTRSEVAFARDHPDTMRLIVVGDITLVSPCDDEVSAQGGRPRMISPWAPQVADLEPISYFCLVRTD